jgi:protein-disulfide isomerase/uncharacterized membrane protein
MALAAFPLIMVLRHIKSICLALTVLGVAISGYLLWRQLVLAGHISAGGGDVCSMLLGMGCDAALKSSTSVQLGLPLAGWGLVYYGTLAACLLLSQPLGADFELAAHLAALLLSLAGAVMSLALAATMLSAGGPFCPLCALVHLINLALLLCLWRMTNRSLPQVAHALGTGARFLITGRTANPIRTRWNVLGLFTVALVAVVLYQWVLIEMRPRPANNPAINARQILLAFDTTIEQDIPIGPDDPSLGPANAAIHLVIFSDFQCPACRGYSHELHALAEQYESHLQIIFKNFPLDRACNPLMKADLHPQACVAAYAAQAAQRQGQFWPFHDKLFDAELRGDPMLFTSLAQGLNLDLNRFNADQAADSAKAKVQADIELALHLNVDATPTLFLNRRRLADNRPEAVRLLIENILHPDND